MNYSIFRVTVQVKTLILLKFFIADSPAKHQQSGKLGFKSLRSDHFPVFGFIVLPVSSACYSFA